jgi:hypothetical protein
VQSEIRSIAGASRLELDDFEKHLALAKSSLEAAGSLIPVLSVGMNNQPPADYRLSEVNEFALPGVILLLSALSSTVFASIGVVYPRAPHRDGLAELPGLIYPPVILDKHGGYAEYRDAVRSHLPDALLDEYAHQIISCGHIFVKKLKLVRFGVIGLAISFGIWFSIVILKISMVFS